MVAPKMWREQEDKEVVTKDEAEAEVTVEVDEKEAKTEAADVMKIKLTQLTPSISPLLPLSPCCPLPSPQSPLCLRPHA